MPQSPLLIILVTKDWYFLSHRLPLAKTLQAAGFRVAVAAHDTGRAQEITTQGFEFYNIDFDRKSINPFTELRTLRQVYELYQKLSPAVVHHIAIKGALYGGIAARLAKVPHAFNTVAGLGYLFSANGKLPRLLRALVSPLFRFAGGRHNSSYIFFNQVDRSTFIAQGFTSQERSCVIPGSGVDLSTFSPTPEINGPFTFVCACRLLADKGIRELIEAARKLKKAGKVFRLVIAGTPDTSNRASIPAHEIDSWKNEKIAELPGFVDDIASLLKESHVAVLPSYYPEGVPLFLIEAAACAKAAITCNTPGCSDIVVDGETGLLVPPRNSEALFQAMQFLMDSPERRQKMGIQARSRCESAYSAQAVGQATLNFYSSRLGPKVAQLRVSQQSKPSLIHF